METMIGIKTENSAAVAHKLAVMLADEILLCIKTRNAHWNVEGADFYSRHKFFEDQYEQLDETMDSVAERIRSIGHYAPATMREILQLTRMTEKRGAANTGNGFIKDLLADHESIIMHLRENINQFANEYHDLGSSDFITGLMKTHEKMTWMLRSQLK